jgi:DNA end-binding protein Ku
MAMESYRVIQEAIAEEKLVGIAKLVMSNRERVVAIEPRDRGMIITTLRSPDEVRDYQPLFEEIDDKPLDREMVKLAKQLIEKMTGPFDPKMFEDRYQNALHELVESKLKGEKLHLPEPKQTGREHRWHSQATRQGTARPGGARRKRSAQDLQSPPRRLIPRLHVGCTHAARGETHIAGPKTKGHVAEG